MSFSVTENVAMLTLFENSNSVNKYKKETASQGVNIYMASHQAQWDKEIVQLHPDVRK
jgi:hypothetical protein